jgi:hypothetical protein
MSLNIRTLRLIIHGITRLSKMTTSITTPGITTLKLMTQSSMILSKMIISITTLSIMIHRSA